VKTKYRVELLAVLGSIVTLIGAHCVFGNEYVLNFFTTIFLVSTIPLWVFMYSVLKNVY
jgi:hypothetical protein